MDQPYLFVPNKIDYIRGKRPRVKCILCGLVRRDKKVVPLIVHESPNFLVSLNMYPYNPGHLFLFPKRHIEDIREMNEPESLELHALVSTTLDVLDRVYHPQGYNVGCNIHRAGGASIDHFHIHLVPRYNVEKSFMDVINGTRIYVEDPKKTLVNLRKAFRSERK